MTEDKEGYRGQKDKNICEEGVEKGGSGKVGTSQTNIWHWKEARSSSSGLKHPQVLDKQQKGVITTINTTVPVSETSVPSPEKGDEKEKRIFLFFMLVFPRWEWQKNNCSSLLETAGTAPRSGRASAYPLPTGCQAGPQHPHTPLGSNPGWSGGDALQQWCCPGQPGRSKAAAEFLGSPSDSDLLQNYFKNTI